MKVLYGNNSTYIDITTKCTSLNAEKIVFIPKGDDARSQLFKEDPIFGVVKQVIVIDDYQKYRLFDDTEVGVVIKDQYGKYDLSISANDVWRIVKTSSMHPSQKLQVAHARIQFDHGSLEEEFPEQIMAMKYIQPTACVLELGGNVGRNSCVIASILDDSSKLVVFECDPDIAQQLQHNRDMNTFRFAIEKKALSKRRLIHRGWDTTPIEDTQNIPSGWKMIDTISWGNLQKKYQHMRFDTLVADCEGALYYILKDEPGFLASFHTAIIENDYFDISHKAFVDSELIRNGFRLVYNEALTDSWQQHRPCIDQFFQTWIKS